MSMDRLLKEAMPPLAADVRVPLRVPPLGLVPRATVTVELSVVARLLNWSSTRTATAGLMATPATALLGCTPKTRWFAAAAEMLKAAGAAALTLQLQAHLHYA